ncbi:MAG TPA: thiamine pyrophosphate-dependent dehydrogenase E1 component subunit alpha [Chloroflexota bacterium]|jgi:pyruvate dehydrogenase E1 component alpha subunit|nr:thiamine pyrophosphate-dependent dehydrogenase E1 component subunit alpha [Chloroflexota bacterium]
MPSLLAPERRVDLLRSMLRIRRLEEHVIHFKHDHSDLIPGHVHVYIGQEAAGVGACALLSPSDYVFTTHRNHGHVLAKGGDPGRILAEIIGRADGYARGRGGTFHVAAPEIGVLHTSAIVAGALPLAAGSAYAAQTLRTGAATIVFFGDGAMEEGGFYEALNIAQLWKLPVVFYMENNSVSPSERPGRGSPTSEHSAASLSDIPRSFSVDTTVIDGTDVEAVYNAVSPLVDRVRKNEGPFFVESRTTRWPGNYGAFPQLLGGDTDIAWSWDADTVPEPVRVWSRESDPVLLYARRLLDEGVLTRESLQELDRAVRDEMTAAAGFALDSPSPEPESAVQFAYA